MSQSSLLLQTQTSESTIGKIPLTRLLRLKLFEKQCPTPKKQKAPLHGHGQVPQVYLLDEKRIVNPNVATFSINLRRQSGCSAAYHTHKTVPNANITIYEKQPSRRQIPHAKVEGTKLEWARFFNDLTPNQKLLKHEQLNLGV
jgi:hypothetical protein